MSTVESQVRRSNLGEAKPIMHLGTATGITSIMHLSIDLQLAFIRWSCVATCRWALFNTAGFGNGC